MKELLCQLSYTAKIHVLRKAVRSLCLAALGLLTRPWINRWSDPAMQSQLDKQCCMLVAYFLI